MLERENILIFYDWFYPGYKAGGPIQSLINLTAVLTQHYNVYVITSSTDLNSEEHYKGIKVAEWNELSLDQFNVPISVYYVEKKYLNKELMESLILKVSPSYIYLNGLFSYRFFLLPLSVVKAFNQRFKVIICPRGMLKKGALSGKWLKKKLYLKYLQLSGLLKDASWHATTKEEADEIQGHFPTNHGIFIAPNIPKPPANSISAIRKEEGELKLVYLALINEHKNLLFLLQVIHRTSVGVTLDIYGPIVDLVYWEKCQLLIQQMPNKVKYKGVVDPLNVHNVLSQYHVFILFTKGENFSHSIYESLSVGRLIITSHYTPWQNLFENEVGANVDIDKFGDCIDKINYFVNMNAEEFNQFSLSAYQYSKKYYENLYPLEKYKMIFEKAEL